MKSVVAVDVGGTTIKGAVVATDGTVLVERSIGTPVADGPDAVVAAVRAFAVCLVQEGREVVGSEVAAVGVVVPGHVDAEAGIARLAANLGWHDVPLRDLVAADTGLPTVLDHDVRAAGVAEATIGQLAGVDDGLLVVIGTGIAAVLVVNGQVVHGATGVAGEFGHLPIWPDGELCPCGQRGCLERYASASAISRRYEVRTDRPLAAAEISRLRLTDPIAAQVWDEAIEALAVGLAAYTMLCDPALIVIGGGLSQAGGSLLHPLRAALAERVRWRPPPPLELSHLGARAGALGAAILATRAADIAAATS